MSNSFDSKKNAINITKHGISFEEVELLEWDTAITRADSRTNYGEERLITYALIEERLYCLVWTMREENIRPISFRKANLKERKRYEKDKKA
jgi:uncharacterized DUF497 family protein